MFISPSGDWRERRDGNLFLGKNDFWETKGKLKRERRLV